MLMGGGAYDARPLSPVWIFRRQGHEDKPAVCGIFQARAQPQIGAALLRGLPFPALALRALALIHSQPSRCSWRKHGEDRSRASTAR